jgi:hypothetical protein
VGCVPGGEQAGRMAQPRRTTLTTQDHAARPHPVARGRPGWSGAAQLLAGRLASCIVPGR